VDGVDFTTLLFADNQKILAVSKDKLQEAVYKLSMTVRKNNLNILSKETKVMGFAEVEPIRAMVIVDEKIIKHINTFKIL
jgi:hypothetical protein